jgi:hypothetical protein
VLRTSGSNSAVVSVLKTKSIRAEYFVKNGYLYSLRDMTDMRVSSIGVQMASLVSARAHMGHFEHLLRHLAQSTEGRKSTEVDASLEILERRRGL